MNKILYWLIGIAVAIAVAASMVDPKVRRPIQFDEPNLFTAFVCLLVIAAGLLFLTHTPLGRRFTSWVQKRARRAEDDVRTTPGKVRKPPDWWLEP